MSMSDLMSRLDLVAYPKIALIIFTAAFVSIIWRTLRRARRDEYRRAASMALDDSPTTITTAPSSAPAPSTPIPAAHGAGS